MSTFNGVLAEFPDIQVDYFRKSDDRPPPLACFLTHVHTDHLQGLESFRAPFIYCSPTTRELLLRLEKFPHRINFEKRILEAREVTYKHLNKLLRPIPLNTPTEIELTPIKKIRVTLIDANHCPGSVMFLIEGNDKTILYTGDIRAEKWWVNSLIRNPFLIPYTLAGKQLDNMYLDTTYLRHAGVPPETFGSKAEGIAELLKKVQGYSPQTVFHLGAWTFGYEEVWLALAAALRTKVHPDAYQLGLYQSLGQASRGLDESAAYNGFRLGNDIIPGCLTNESGDARIHLCVPPCGIAAHPDTVHIRPFLMREKDGFEVPDMGAGGGSGDVYMRQELEFPPKMKAKDLVQQCHDCMLFSSEELQTELACRLLNDFETYGGRLSLSKYGISVDENISLHELACLLVHHVLQYNRDMAAEDEAKVVGMPRSKVIRFPYARHSSYSELCHLISVFKPKDIHACVVEDRDVSGGKDLVDEFFGHLLTGRTHDSKGIKNREVQVEETNKAWAVELEARENHELNGFPEPTPLSDPPEDPQPHNALGQLGYESLRRMNNQWLLFANVEHDFSSLPIAEPGLTNKPPQVCGPTTPDGVKEKRDEIQRAHEYLQGQTYPSEMQVGPLPPTWFGGLDGADASKTDKQKKEKQVKESAETKKSPTKWTPFMILKRPTTVSGQVQGGSSSHVQSPAEPTSNTLQSQASIPESILAPSLTSSHSGNLTRERLEELDAQQRKEIPSASQKRARVEAYLAATEDSFSAWAGMITSAGDNHAEEEMEL